MMKVKPFNYHIPPRRKAYPTTSTTTNTTTTNVALSSSSSTTSLSSPLPARTNFHSSHSYTCREYSSNCRSNNNYALISGRSRKVRERGNSSRNSTTSSHSNVISLRSLCGIGGITALTIILLIGFIGVAGQGKFTGMDEESSAGRLTSQTPHISYPQSLSYQSTITSFQNVADDSFDRNSDEALQQRVPSMGHYGIKYRNVSYNNYSSNHSPSYYNPHYHHHQYKHEHGMGTLLPSTPEDNQSLLLSLHADDNINNNNHNLHNHNFGHVNNHVKKDQSSTQNNSEKLENKISLKTIALKLKRQQTKDADEDALPKEYDVFVSNQKFLPVGEWGVLNDKRATDTSYESHKTLSNNLKTHAKFTINDKAVVEKSHFNKYKRGEERERKRKKNVNSYSDKKIGKESWPSRHSSSSSDAGDEHEEEEQEENDDYTLERFIPGNSSHTSGKLRFRQSSQAEVDILDPDVDFSVPKAIGGSTSSRRRPRRSVVHLYDMVVCSTGCNPLIFKGYGCYCGFLGSGLTVDGIDKCCAKHDFCYHHAKCPPLLTYFVPYYWRCDHGRPQCVTDFRGWKGVCGAHLCECDRQFAECLKKYPCPRSRAMCVTSPFSNQYSDPRALPFTVGRRPPRPPWALPAHRYAPLFHFPPPHSPLSPLASPLASPLDSPLPLASPLAMGQVFA